MAFRLIWPGQWEWRKWQTLIQKSQDQVGCVLGWKCTNSPDAQLVYYIPLTKEVGQLISVVGQVWQCLRRGAVLYGNPLGGGSCNWYFLYTLSTMILKPGESLDIPVDLRHWGPWHSHIYSTNAHLHWGTLTSYKTLLIFMCGIKGLSHDGQISYHWFSCQAVNYSFWIYIMSVRGKHHHRF